MAEKVISDVSALENKASCNKANYQCTPKGCSITCVYACRAEAKKQQDLMVAADAMEDSASKKEEPKTTKRMPYRGTSRWSRLLKVSTLQRSVQIWSFAALFAIRYFLTTRKFTYGKKVRQ